MADLQWTTVREAWTGEVTEAAVTGRKSDIAACIKSHGE